MKRIFLGLAFVLAIGGAIATNSSTQAAEQRTTAPILMYEPTTCAEFNCDSQFKEVSCIGLRQGSCTGSPYSGPLKRD